MNEDDGAKVCETEEPGLLSNACIVVNDETSSYSLSTEPTCVF